MLLFFFHRVFKKASPNGKVILHSFCPFFILMIMLLLVVLTLILQRFSVSECSTACYGYDWITTNIEQQSTSCSKIWFDACDTVSQTNGSQLTMIVRLAYSHESICIISRETCGAPQQSLSRKRAWGEYERGACDSAPSLLQSWERLY